MWTLTELAALDGDAGEVAKELLELDATLAEAERARDLDAAQALVAEARALVDALAGELDAAAAEEPVAAPTIIVQPQITVPAPVVQIAAPEVHVVNEVKVPARTRVTRVTKTLQKDARGDVTGTVEEHIERELVTEGE